MHRSDAAVQTATGGKAVTASASKSSRPVLLGAYPALLELLKITLFAAAYLGGYACSRYFAQRTGTRLWLPDSILLCTLLLVPRKKWWLYILVTAPARFVPWVRAPAPAWFLWANWINDIGKAMLAAYLLQYATGNSALFKRVRQYATYLGVAVILAPLLSAFFGALARLTLGHAFWPAFGQWYLGDALANLVVTPTLFLWFSHEYRRLGHRLFETAVWATGFAICLGYVVQSTRFNESLIALYAPFPFLIWAAVRLGATGASSGLSLTTLFVILGLSQAKGPFYPIAHDMHFVQLFLAVLALPILFVATFFEERQAVEQRLRESREELNRDYERVSDLARRLINARGDERKKIETELHDDVSQQLAVQIAALQRERERQSAAELDAMVRLQEVGMRCLQTGDDVKGALNAVLDAAISLTNAAKGNIQLLDHSLGGLRLVVQQGFESRFLDRFAVVTNQATSCRAAMDSRERVVVEDMLESKIFAGTPELQVLLDAGVRAVQSTPLLSSSGQLLGMVSTYYATPHRPRERELRLMDLLARQAADYLERKQAEEALTASSAQLRRFLEAAPTGLVRCNRDLRYLSANSAFAAIAGVPLDQILGRRIVDVIGLDAWEKIRPYVERALRGERVEYETLLPYATAGPRQIHVAYTPEKDGQEVVGFVASITDITEFKRVEKQLQEVEKMAAAGQLAASLAHEINNPLSAVINVLYLLGRRSDLNPAATSLVSTANNEIARVARIVKQSLSYYRVGRVAKEVDLIALIEESLQVFSDKFQHGGIAISKRITPGTSIIGFADEIRQVVDNLLVNAVEATPRGGRLTLCLRQSRSWKERSEMGARFTIADNGCGIPKPYLARVFEPFFTTKAEKGTGLGLWVVKGIIEKHGGSIKIRSTDAAARSGTVISIFWPSAVEEQPTSKLARPDHAA